jgi:hypothetical protein
MEQSALLRPPAWHPDHDSSASETRVRRPRDLTTIVRRTGVKTLRFDAGELGKWTAR